METQQPPSTQVQGRYPQDVFLKKWSWGGFFVTPIWALGSKLYLAGVLLLLFGYIIPFIALGFGIYYGIKGRQIAWTTRKWESFEQFRKRQNIIDNIGFALFILSLVLYFIANT